MAQGMQNADGQSLGEQPASSDGFGDVHASGFRRIGDVTRLAGQITLRAARSREFPKVDIRPFVDRIIADLAAVEEPIQALGRLVIEDLYLAYACHLGDESALQAFARECEPEFQSVVARLNLASADVDDLRQKLWDKLFLAGSGSSSRILEYRGIGRLRHWVRIMAARLALDEFRRAKRRGSERDLAQGASLLLSAKEADPEIENLLQQYRPIFREAFERAVGSLEPQDRNLLKCHFVKGMSTEQIGASFGVHKATAARHLVRARERLLDGVRRQVRGLSGANSEELDSVIRMFEGNVSLSLSRLLG
jgi:RNA polymerase sigma-70 factor, ECF subfamily